MFNKKEWTKEWKLKSPWRKHYYKARQRCLSKKGSYYGKIKFEMSLSDFRNLWFRDKAYLLKKPSIDRINSRDNYRLDNCRFIEHKENCRLSSIGKHHSPKSKELISRGLKRFYFAKEKYHNLFWLKEQLKFRTQKSIAKECGIDKSTLSNFIDRYIRHPECKTWIEYYKIKNQAKQEIRARMEEGK